jgi:hypothetical protein
MAPPALAQAVPAKIADFLELCESSRRGAIAELEHTLRGLRSQPGATRATRLQIARAEEQLRVLRANAKPVVPQLAFPPQVGAIGRLPGLSCHVEEIVSGDEMIVRCFFPVVVRTVKNFAPRGEKVTQEVMFVLRGLPTKKMHVGNDYEMLDVFEIAGKLERKGAGGATKSVPVLTVFDMQAVTP